MEIIENAYAKLNISLDVTGKREDGFHDMNMVMQTVSLCDRVTLRDGTRGRPYARTNLSYLPNDEKNLAVKAALQYCLEAGLPFEGFSISVDKRIPVGAGMAGGSADAAAVIRAMNRLKGGLLDRTALLKVAERVGSDVAFCLVGGTMQAHGRGELLSPLRPMPDCAYVICKPEFSVSTPELFSKIDSVKLKNHPDTQGIIDALENGNLGSICRRMYNVFEDVPDRRMKTAAVAKGMLLDLGAMGAVMTGTGSAVFGVFEEEAAAEKAAEALKAEYSFVCTASNVDTLLK